MANNTFEAAYMKLKNGMTLFFKDGRARELLAECYSPSNPPMYALAPYPGGPAKMTNGIHYAEVDGASTATVFTADVPGITEYYDGLTVVLRNGVVTSASGFTININGLGAKPVYSNLAAATAETTIFNVAYTMMFIYDSTRVAGGCWVCYKGYDSNTNTIGYQIRTNSQSKPMDSVTYRYRLLFTSADGKKYVPANNSTSTNATALRPVCQTPIDPFGPIVYYGTTTSVAAGSRPGAAYLWEQYTLTLGYSFNRTGAALTLSLWEPVYLKCAPQADGSAIMDDTTPYVQSLPTTEDGKIYILLGTAYSATQIELLLNHPVYYYKGGAIRPWVNSNGRQSPCWYAVCSSSYSDAAKTATSATGDFVLATGNMVRVKFTNTNNQLQPTLSVDGSTAARIKNLPSESNINTQWWRAGEVIDLVYDGTDFIMSDGGQASTGYYGKTILSNSTSSSSQTTAATSKAVKDTYDAIPSPSDATPQDLGMADPGVSDDYSRADHVHNMPTASDLVDLVYPVGSIYMSVNSTSPASLFGGTWTQIEDTFLLAAGQTYTAGDTGGEASHTLIKSELPAEKLNIYVSSGWLGYQNTNASSGSGIAGLGYQIGTALKTENMGSGNAHNNMPPYLVVYMWQRVS